MASVEVDRSDGVVTVTLNRPEKKNAVDNAMWDALKAAFDEVAERSEDRVLVVTGAGGDFCSGADLTSATGAEHGLTRMRRIGNVALALHRLPKPTIARVQGVAVGAGCNLAVGCDLVVASEDARFSEIFARRGLSLDFGGSWLLPRVVGMRRAKELALLADIIDARQAEAYGLVNRVVPAEQLDEAVGEWARRLAAGPPVALSLSKRLLDSAMSVTMDQALEDEARAQNVNFATADTVEAFRAFAEKRAPTFTGASLLG